MTSTADTKQPHQENPVPSPSSEPELARVSPVRRVLDGIGVQNGSLIITLVVLLVVISSLNSTFFTTANLLQIGSAITIMGLLALVQTLVIILGALDISVGSMAGLADRKSTV